MLQTAGEELTGGGVEEEEEEREGVKMEMKRKRRREKVKRELVMEEDEAGAEEEDSSEDIAQDMSGGEDQEDLEMRRVLLPHLEKRKEETWREMMEAGEEDVVVAVEDSEDAVVSVDVEDSAELDSVEDLEEEGVDSEATGEVSVAVAGLEEPEEDSAEVGEDSVEATTEEKAVLKSTIFTITNKFSNLPKISSLPQPHRLKFFFFIFDNSLLDFLLYSYDQSYKITRV